MGIHLLDERANKENNHYVRLYQKYQLIAMNLFRWENLPNNLEGKHVEYALYKYGQCVFLEDKTKGFMVVGCNGVDEVNYLGEHTKVVTTGYNYVKNVNLIKSKEDKKLYKKYLHGVRIGNNDLFYSNEKHVLDYVDRMYNVENAININVEQQKFPYIIGTDSKNELTLKTMFDNIKRGAYAIFTRKKNIDLNDVEVFNLNVPYVVDKLNQYRFELERDFLTTFGLNNNFEKKERLLVDEVNSNNDYISRNVDLMLKARQDAVKIINELYGLDIKVSKIEFHMGNVSRETTKEEEKINIEKSV